MMSIEIFDGGSVLDIFVFDKLSFLLSKSRFLVGAFKQENLDQNWVIWKFTAVNYFVRESLILEEQFIRISEM